MTVRYIIAAILIILGITVMTVGVFGVFRIRYILNRLHASAMGDSMGMFFIAAGLIVLYGISMPGIKLVFILALFWCASPVCSHLMTTLEGDTNTNISAHCPEMPLEEAVKEEE